jgi:metal-responsive CopG/Arc/MetJ family transcriptional regulator
MSKAISVRLDETALRALARLEAAGMSRSNAIRRAILEAAEHRRRPEVIRAEVAAIAADPRDRAEMAAVLEDMEDLRDPW